MDDKNNIIDFIRASRSLSSFSLHEYKTLWSVEWEQNWQYRCSHYSRISITCCSMGFYNSLHVSFYNTVDTQRKVIIFLLSPLVIEVLPVDVFTTNDLQKVYLVWLWNQSESHEYINSGLFPKENIMVTIAYCFQF